MCGLEIITDASACILSIRLSYYFILVYSFAHLMEASFMDFALFQLMVE